jgi:hypothetical protein
MTDQLTDQFCSRLLASIRQHKNIKSIKNIKGNSLEAEMKDGSVEVFLWEELFDQRKIKKGEIYATQNV